MNAQSRENHSKVFVAALTLSVFLAGCKDGGGGGGDEPVLLSIAATGIASPLWQGSIIGPPLCPGPLAQNAALVFTFGAAVDPGSIPTGLITGSIAVTDPLGGPIEATTRIEDDPSLPPGNRRRVVLQPRLPASPMEFGPVGLRGPGTFNVTVASVGQAASTVTFAGGQPLANGAQTCFTVCDSTTAPCYQDLVPGPPFIASTTPDSSPAGVVVESSSIAGNTVRLQFSEPLDPRGIDTSSVRLVNTQSAAQIPGAVVFFQGGTVPGEAGARINYVAASLIPPGATYVLQISTAVRDFGGNPAVSYAPSTGGLPPGVLSRFIITAPRPLFDQPPIIEDFSTTSQRGAVTGAIVWNGSGALTVASLADYVGDGAFGPFAVPTGPSTLDLGMIAGPGFNNGTFDATSVTIPLGAVVRVVGHTTMPSNVRRLHFRATGVVSIHGTVNGSAGTSVLGTVPIGSPEQGARPGGFNNGGGIPGFQVVAGGVGGIGAGAGGRASQGDQVGPPVRTPRGEKGFGAPDNLQPNPGTSPASFGGGDGGAGAFLFPGGGASGDLGGLGGAGGSALTAGSDGGPNSAMPACAPVSGNQIRAAATGPVAAFMPPISVAGAGSGGGSGGDHYDLSGPPGDDQGGGGGGGGGGIRISAMGDVTLGSAAVIFCLGAAGGTGNIFQGGHGGGGSGGQIWIASAQQVDIASTASLSATFGSVASACGSQASGRGGLGLIQLEDAEGVINTGFIANPANGQNIVALQSPLSNPVRGTGTSTFFDTGYGNPDFTQAQVLIQFGQIPGAQVTVTFQGAHALVNNSGPDLTTLTPPVPAANIDQLDGHRYLRFTAVLEHPLFPFQPPAVTRPQIDEIRILFRTP